MKTKITFLLSTLALLFSAFLFAFLLPVTTLALTLDTTGGDCPTIGTWDAPTQTCTLTQNITETFVINADDVTLDGAGHTITRTATSTGITVSAHQNVVIKNLTISGFGTGMSFWGFGHSLIEGNTILTGGQTSAIGISLGGNGTSNTVVKNNIIEGGGMAGIYGGDADSDIFEGNTVKNFQIGLRFEYCAIGHTFRGNTIEGNTLGAFFAGSTGTFSRNNFKNNGRDIENQFLPFGCGRGVETFSEPLPVGGNYWSANTACFDSNHDNICDTPYLAATTTDGFGAGTISIFDNFPWASENGWNLPTSTPPILTNPTETEDDGKQDGKGVADKTNFTFSVTAEGEPDSVNLFVNGAAIAFVKTGNTYTATSTFPKGHYTWHIEAIKGTETVGTAEQHFTTGYSNVAFLPGLEASRLYKPDYAGGTDDLWEPYSDADAANLSLDSDGKSVRNDIYTKDVVDNAYVPIVGNVYKSFLEQLNAMKNTDHVIVDYAVMPYDWRLSLDEILTSGKKNGDNISYLQATSTPYIIQELNRLAESSDTGKVTLVAHSNGGLVAKALTNKLGTDAPKLIDQMIFVAVPQAGTPKAIGAILHGFEQELPTILLAFGITPQGARELARNMPSAYNLLPSFSYFTYVNDPVVKFATTSAFLASWVDTYGDTIHSSERLHNFLADQSRASSSPDLYYPIGGNETLLNRAELLHATLDNWTPPAGVILTEIAGWGEKTISTIEYVEGVKGAYDEHGDLHFSPSIQYDVKEVLDGDGTVVVPSALWTPGAGKYWVNLDDYNGVFTIERKHADILEVKELRDFIKNLIVRNNIIPKDYVTASAPVTKPSKPRLSFALHSPLSLDLYDNFGNHTGVSTTTGFLEQNIPDSRYETFGELKYISVQTGVPLHLALRGYAAGSFTLDIKEFLGDTVTASTTFAGIPSFVGTIATIDIPQDGNIANSSPLVVDENNDGIPEFTLSPKLGGVVLPQKPVLTVTADNKNITLGASIPSLTASFSSAVNDVTGAPNCTTTATVNSTVGTYTITCTVGTLASNTYDFAFATGTLTILYRFDGFLQPINDIAYHPTQAPSVFKGGSTVPVKFQIKKADGTPIQAGASPLWLTPQKGASMSASVDESTYTDPATTGNTFKWDSGSQQYIYNWSTKGFTSGYWYRLSTKLDDGKTYSVTVGLR